MDAKYRGTSHDRVPKNILKDNHYATQALNDLKLGGGL